MKTVILDRPGELRFVQTEAPTAPGPGEALVRVRRVGICGTDLHAFRGEQPFFSYPRILGHELGVEVVALAPDANRPDLAPGDICAVEPYLNCGVCSACRRGKTNCCEKLQVLGVHRDGGMRELITIPATKLYKTNGLSVDQLALVEMLCIGAHAVRRCQPEPGEPALVIGAGPIGLSVIQFAQLAGAEVVVLEVSPQRQAFCRRQLGIERMLDGEGDTVARLRGLFGGDLPTLVFDATGNTQSMHAAFQYVANGGKLVFVGLVQADITFHDPEFHRREMTLLSSRNAASADFVQVIQSLESGNVALDAWITHRSGPAEIVSDFPQWVRPGSGVVKAVLEM
jgi:2-desacetyl-2-hydroxyethyl bacteriochlorophyllide A dehydrogenase